MAICFVVAPFKNDTLQIFCHASEEAARKRLMSQAARWKSSKASYEVYRKCRFLDAAAVGAGSLQCCTACSQLLWRDIAVPLVSDAFMLSDVSVLHSLISERSVV